MKKILSVLAVCLALAACSKDSAKYYSDDSSYDLDGCTAIYKGTSMASEVETADLIMYSTDKTDEYFIPRFFQGEGGIEFSWDKKTNELRVITGLAGVSSALTAIEVCSQSEYESLMGVGAVKSFYDPVTASFTFNVLMKSMTDSEHLSQFTTLLTFTITEEIK